MAMPAAQRASTGLSVSRVMDVVESTPRRKYDVWEHFDRDGRRIYPVRGMVAGAARRYS